MGNIYQLLMQWEESQEEYSVYVSLMDDASEGRISFEDFDNKHEDYLCVIRKRRNEAIDFLVSKGFPREESKIAFDWWFLY